MANILFFLSNITNKLNKKIIFLVSVINKTIDVFIFKIKLGLRLVLEFHEKYKNAQIKAKRFKKNPEKRKNKKNFEKI